MACRQRWMAFVQVRRGVGLCRSGSFWREVLDRVLDALDDRPPDHLAVRDKADSAVDGDGKADGVRGG